MSTALIETNQNGVAEAHRVTAMTLPGHSACPKLSEALAAARDRCKGASKDGDNKFQHYKYATADEVIATASEALQGSGLAIIPVSEELVIAGFGSKTFYALNRVMILSHASGEFTSLEVRGWPVIEDKGRPLDKAYAIALTSSLSYKLRDLLQMPRGDQFADDMNQRDDREHAPQSAPATDPRQVAIDTLKAEGLPVQLGTDIKPPAEKKPEKKAPVLVSAEQAAEIDKRLTGWCQGLHYVYKIQATAELHAKYSTSVLQKCKLIADIEEAATKRNVPFAAISEEIGKDSFFALGTAELQALLESIKARPALKKTA